MNPIATNLPTSIRRKPSSSNLLSLVQPASKLIQPKQEQITHKMAVPHGRCHRVGVIDENRSYNGKPSIISPFVRSRGKKITSKKNDDEVAAQAEQLRIQFIPLHHR